jgi:hypothetical protein
MEIDMKENSKMGKLRDMECTLTLPESSSQKESGGKEPWYRQLNDGLIYESI